MQPLSSMTEDDRLIALRSYEILDTPADGAFDRIAKLAASFFKVPISLISLVDQDRIWFKARHGLDATEIPRHPGLCASAAFSDAAYVVKNAINDPRTLANPLVVGELGLRFYAAAPLITRDGYRLGTINIIDFSPREFDRDSEQILEQFAGLVMDQMELRLSVIKTAGSLARTNEKLMESIEQISRISAFDELTNLPNRRALMARLEQEQMRTKRTGEIFSVALIDLDHFKQINDTYGHHVGDEVLKLFSTRASHAMRAVDLFGRYGGEEFLAILTGIERNAAAVTIERVLAIAAAGNYSAVADGLTVSASAGIATRGEKESVHQLLERADKALYEAKRGGRNRVVLAVL